MGNSRYIAIEGPIGVGKTSLARRLADSLDGELLLEQPEANPFLERFYRDPRGASLPTQLFFLFQRAADRTAAADRHLCGDPHLRFLIGKDRLLARSPDRAELDLYDKVADRWPSGPLTSSCISGPVDTCCSGLRAGASTSSSASGALLGAAGRSLRRTSRLRRCAATHRQCGRD
jgi:hypothetical protein